MKVLFITPYLGASYGGVTRLSQGLASSLGASGVELDFITTLADDHQTLRKPTQTWLNRGSYRLQYFPCWHRRDFILSWSLIQWLNKNVRNYDLVHTHTLFCPLVSWTAKICQRQHVPYIMTPHGMLEPWAFSYKAWKKKLYYNLVESNILNRSASVHSTSSVELANLHSYSLKAPKFLIPNGIHAKDLQYSASPQLFYQTFPKTQEKTLILFLARIDPKKGLDLLAPAFAQVYQQFPKSHLVIAGPDSIGFQPIAEQYFHQVSCQNAVTFTGMLTGELKQSALAVANIYVAPSYSEGFSMSVLEGMASGLPCVITTGCNFPEAEAANVAQVVEINADAIYQALLWCLQNLDQAQAMGARAREFVLENYTWDKIATKMIAAYQAIIDRKIQ